MKKILNILKLNKVLNILIILIVVYTMLSFSNITTIKSYAVGSTYTYNPSTVNNDLPDNFDTLYPGYKSLIQTVLTSHPTWTIKLIDTGLVWDTVINNEYTGHGSSPKNLVPANNSNYSGDWICQICGATPYDNGNWYCASRSAIAYMMDPRNSLNNSDIFQFQDLSSTTATRESIQQMVSGTFINNDECIDAILTAATTYSVSPYHLVSRIIQEQGTNGSTLGLGIEDSSNELITITTVNLRSSPSITGTVIASIAKDTAITRIEMATNINDGYYWDKVTTTKGTGYIAREFLLQIDSTISNDNYSTPNNNNIFVEPDTKVIKLKEKYNIIKSKDGIILEDNTLVPTGSILKPTEESIEEYKIIKLGDINEDGIITPADFVKIRNHIMNTANLTDYYLTAADINKDGNITPADFVKVRNHIMGDSKISIESKIKYYNLFNIEASGNNASTIIAKGLTKAKISGWTSMRSINNRRS